MNNRSYLSELLNIVLLVVVMYLIFTRGCGGGKNVVVLNDTVTSVSYIHDTVWHAPVVKTIHTPAEIVYRDVEKKLDTVFIIRKFAASYFYDEMISDSNIDIHVLDTISMNEIVWRDVKYLWKKPTTVIDNNVTQVTTAKAKLFAGINLGGNKESFSAITPEIELIFYDSRAFSVGYNFHNKSVELGVKWRVGK